MPFTDQTAIAGQFALDAGAVFEVLPNAAKTAVARDFLDALMDYAGATQLDPRVLVKMWLLETNNGTSIRWTRDRNPAGIGIPADDTPQPFPIENGSDAAAIFVQAVYSLVRREFATPVSASPGARQWLNDVWLPKVQSPSAPPVRVVNDLGLKYKDTARDGRPRATWAWDDDYGKKLVGRFRNELAHLFDMEGGTMATPAQLDYSSLSFPVEIRFIPDGQTNQQPGIPMTPKWTTWHDTGNTTGGADAEMHARYMANGCPDEHGRATQKSWHFTVDSNRAIQHIQLNRVGWHAGDGTGPGNHSAIGIEECVNSDRNVAKTRQNAAELHALLIRELGLQGGVLDALVQHNHWSGKNCPATIRGQGAWPELRTLVASFLHTAAPSMPEAEPPPLPYLDAIVGDGQVVIAMPEGFSRVLNRDVVPRQWAMPNANAVTPGSVEKGTEVEVAFLCEGTDGEMWVLTTNGWRFHADAILQIERDDTPVERSSRVGRIGAREDEQAPHR